MVLNPSPYSLFPFEDHYLDLLNTKKAKKDKLEAAQDVEHGRKVALSLATQLEFSRDVGLEWITPEQCFGPGPAVDWMPAVEGMQMANRIKAKK